MEISNLEHTQEEKALIITGMHRSGTSLVSSFLSNCGLYIGNELLGPAKGNPKGYFEDKEFVEFHDTVLKKNYLSVYIWRSVNLRFDTEDIEKALRLSDNRSSQGLFGWKDPRTTFFLSFWNSILKKPLFLFVFRDPLYVIDSLIRRGIDLLLKWNPILASYMWSAYNSEILGFYRCHRDICFLAYIRNIVDDPCAFISHLNEKLHLSLTYREFNEVFDRNLLKLNRNNWGYRSRIAYLITKDRLNMLFDQLLREKDF